MEGFKRFIKLFIGLLCWVCVGIASIGAITTGDTFIRVCGVVAIFTLAYYAYRFINSHSGGYETKE